MPKNQKPPYEYLVLVRNYYQCTLDKSSESIQTSQLAVEECIDRSLRKSSSIQARKIRFRSNSSAVNQISSDQRRVFMHATEARPMLLGVLSLNSGGTSHFCLMKLVIHGRTTIVTSAFELDFFSCLPFRIVRFNAVPGLRWYARPIHMSHRYEIDTQAHRPRDRSMSRFGVLTLSCQSFDGVSPTHSIIGRGSASTARNVSVRLPELCGRRLHFQHIWSGRNSGVKFDPRVDKSSIEAIVCTVLTDIYNNRYTVKHLQVVPNGFLDECPILSGEKKCDGFVTLPDEAFMSKTKRCPAINLPIVTKLFRKRRLLNRFQAFFNKSKNGFTAIFRSNNQCNVWQFRYQVDRNYAASLNFPAQFYAKPKVSRVGDSLVNSHADSASRT
ncbi:hypothetical protein CLF_102548 [Clonorchis sinensis]|uniref:Uncharacterized protein n=1 Tax=Clonorchis sinensis TaxID=79923 RepID=G7Y837_CLOSI|nr:hypothetical protein CLF_102548 [Clonorchis sinensis]